MEAACSTQWKLIAPVFAFCSSFFKSRFLPEKVPLLKGGDRPKAIYTPAGHVVVSLVDGDNCNMSKARELREFFEKGLLKEYKLPVEIVTYVDEVLKYTAEQESNAATDTLTGCFSRRMFDMDMKEALKRGDKGVALAIYDVDDFKAVNDNFGHPEGDKVLSYVAEALSGSSRGRCYRIGGEEFSHIIQQVQDLDLAFEIAERGRIAVAQRKLSEIVSIPAAHPSRELLEEMAEKPITISGGVSILLPGDNKEATSLVHEADDALYYAKNHGKNRISVYGRDI